MLELFSYGMEPWPGLNGAEVSRGSKQGLLSMQVHSINRGYYIKGVMSRHSICYLLKKLNFFLCPLNLKKKWSSFVI